MTLRLPWGWLLVGLAFPSTGFPLSDETCFSCHANSEALAEAGDRAKGLVVGRSSLKGSSHDGLSCTQCHVDLADDNAPLPHPKRLKPADCAACHGEQAAAVASSVHGLFPLGATARSGCAGCHGGHGIRPAADPESSTHRRHLADSCARCHLPSAKGTDPVTLWKNSVHGRGALDWEIEDAPTCEACHKPHQVHRVEDPADPLNRRNRLSACGSCHPSEFKAVTRGVHGKARLAGNLAAPDCTDCHGSHGVEPPRERGSRVYATQVSTTCGRCHGDPELTTRFGLRPDRVSTFEDSFHGKGTRWKDSQVANCASCHRYHDVRTGSDPASPVHPRNLQKTCDRPDCHPGATADFARLPVHAGAQIPKQSLLRSIRTGYILLISLTLAFMAIHQTLYIRALFRARRQGHYISTDRLPVSRPPVKPLSQLIEREEGPVIQRWNTNMVFQHMALTISFATLGLTGFLLELPAVWAGRLGGLGPTLFNLRGILHRIAAVLLIGGAVYHLWWLAFNARGRQELVELLPQPLFDLQQMLQAFAFFLGLRKDPPPGRRYNYREKLEYWALIWGTIVMAGTGIILWSAAHWPWIVVEISRVVHTFEAILAFGAILIWHLFSVQFRPGIPGTHPTWIDGTITAGLMLEEHAEEYRALVAWHGRDLAAVPPATGASGEDH